MDSCMMHDIPSPNRFADTMPHSQLDDDKYSDADGTAHTFALEGHKHQDDRQSMQQARVSSPGSKDSRKPGITTMMSSPIDHGFLDEDTTLTLNIIIVFRPAFTNHCRSGIPRICSCETSSTVITLTGTTEKRQVPDAKSNLRSDASSHYGSPQHRDCHHRAAGHLIGYRTFMQFLNKPRQISTTCKDCSQTV
ncbi:hypothetical protein B0O80DRAFT_503636 [Mortierella sp. GBAus27b]|nr:hypothetical protein B0O80DRAFT_503636 [Mortierella sp. GBAus27b]